LSTSSATAIARRLHRGKSNRPAILYYDKTGFQEISDLSQTPKHQLDRMQV